MYRIPCAPSRSSRIFRILVRMHGFKIWFEFFRFVWPRRLRRLRIHRGCECVNDFPNASKVSINGLPIRREHRTAHTFHFSEQVFHLLGVVDKRPLESCKPLSRARDRGKMLDSPTAQKANQWGRLGLMRYYPREIKKDSPPVGWPRTRKMIYLGDSDEPRCVIIKCLQNRLHPHDIDVFDCPRIRIRRVIDCSGAHIRDPFSFRCEFLHVMVSKGKHKMSSFDIPSPGLQRSSVSSIW